MLDICVLYKRVSKWTKWNELQHDMANWEMAISVGVSCGIMTTKVKVEGRRKGKGRGRERRREREIGSEALAETEKNHKRPSRESNPEPQQTRLMLYHWATETSDITSHGLFVWNFIRSFYWADNILSLPSPFDLLCALKKKTHLRIYPIDYQTVCKL